ncbi:MAG: signal peptidase II [Patescibacteria group bacterium]
MTKQTRCIGIAALSGFLFFLDQYLKYQIRLSPAHSAYIWKPFIGWEYFANRGVAFGLPVSALFVAAVTPVIIGVLVWWLWKLPQKNQMAKIALLLIINGALSNYLDRIVFGFTIDYLRVFTGVINVADAMIAVGFGMLAYEQFVKKA